MLSKTQRCSSDTIRTLHTYLCIMYKWCILGIAFNKNLPTITFDSRGKFTKKSMLKIIDGIKKGYKIKDLADDSKKTE